MKSNLVAALVGVFLFCIALLSFARPTLCSTGCGNLLEPVFQVTYHLFGPWGVRAVLLTLAGFSFYIAIRDRE